MILKHLLVDPDIVVHLKTVKDLWACLVYVACRQTGSQRLKAIELLLIILKSYQNQTPTTPTLLGATAAPIDGDDDEVVDESLPDLTLLEPLWRLFAKLSKNVSSYSIAPSVYRALTELFFAAENMAISRGLEKEYFIAMTDLAEIRKAAAVGFLNVAAVGLMINVENKATNAVLLGKQKSAAKTPSTPGKTTKNSTGKNSSKGNGNK